MKPTTTSGTPGQRPPHPERRPPEHRAPELVLVREAAITDLLPAGSPTRLEASGVAAIDGRFTVVFDNLRAVAIINQDLDQTADNTLVPTDAPGTQPSGKHAYEDIAWDAATGHRYLVIEATRRHHSFQARVEEYDRDLHLQSASWLEYPLPNDNKGIEALACLRRADQLHLLGLPEGNRIHGGKKARRPGGGRILVFRHGHRNWKHHATIALPTDLWFTDYSSITTTANRVAVLSQESSALWLGHLAPDTWELAGPGDTYQFPRAANGDITYRTVEGVSWLDSHHIVVVSDKVKTWMHEPADRAKDQALHIFALPDLHD